MTKSFFLLATCLIHSTFMFSLEGNWDLVTIADYNTSVFTEIAEYVFRSTLIMNRISFRTCNSLSYQVTIDENNFWVNIDSELIDTTSNCSDNNIMQTQLIRQTIRSVFTFDIFKNQLYFYDTSEEVLMIFNRSIVKDQEQKFKKGSWSFNLIEESEKYYEIIVDQSTITTCNGSIYKYQIKSSNTIVLSAGSSECKDPLLAQGLAKIVYFKKIEGVIMFYDAKINLIGQGSVNLHSKITSNPIQSSKKMLYSSSVISKKENNSPIGLKTGNYILLLLYRRDLMRVKIQITTTEIQLTLCSKLVFNYSLGLQPTISITSSSLPNQKCSKADQSIYFNYIISSTTYNIDPDQLITLIDASNKNIISLVPQ